MASISPFGTPASGHLQCKAPGFRRYKCPVIKSRMFSACIESGVWRRRRAARGEPEDPRGGQQPYVSAEGHTILDLYFGALNVSVHPVVCMLQFALSFKRDVLLLMPETTVRMSPEE